MVKKNSTPMATVASDATGGQDNPGVTTEVGTLIDPSGAPDETFDAMVLIVRSPIIAYIIKQCKFPDDSTLVEYINQQGWTELIHVTTFGLDEVKDFHTVRDDGVTYSTKPMLIHLCLLKCFLLYYKRQCRERFTSLSEDDVMYGFSHTRLEEHCSLDDYNDDLTGVSKPVSTSIYSGNVVASGEMTVQEFRRGVRRDKAHHVHLKDDKYFNLWNCGFVATAYMHHSHLVLNKKYVPKTPNEIEVFQEIQTFMYVVMEEKLKLEKGKSLISEFKEKHDAQSVYRKLKTHALGSTATQLSGDTLLDHRFIGMSATTQKIKI
jgi:hypothetical protein